MWPHWGEGQRGPARPSSLVYLWVLKWDQSLNRKSGMCTTKQSWSACGRPISAESGSSSKWFDKSLELPEISFWGQSSSSWRPFLLLWDFWGNSHFRGVLCLDTLIDTTAFLEHLHFLGACHTGAGNISGASEACLHCYIFLLCSHVDFKLVLCFLIKAIYMYFNFHQSRILLSPI